MTHTITSLRKEMRSCINHYGDAVQGSDEDYSLSDFVTYLVCEVLDKAERIEIRVALETMLTFDAPEDAAE